jgi:hypothetical protein
MLHKIETILPEAPILQQRRFARLVAVNFGFGTANAAWTCASPPRNQIIEGSPG